MAILTQMTRGRIGGVGNQMQVIRVFGGNLLVRQDVRHLTSPHHETRRQ